MRKIKFAPGEVYHIYNRGVDKRKIFEDESDRWRFLQGLYLFNSKQDSHNILWNLEISGEGANMKTLKKFLDQNKDEREPLVKIMADCLMPNHFHLILQELEKDGISKFMHKLGTGYTQFFNKKSKRSGSLFQGPFNVVHIDSDLQLQYLLAYINIINPGQLIEPKLKEEGIKDTNLLLEFAKSYQWSTHQDYLGIRDSFIIDKGVLGELFLDCKRYEEFGKMVLESKKYQQIDKLTLE